MQSTRQELLPRPDHVAVIMDGNGRWAAQRGRPRWAGHRAGAQAARRLIRACATRGVPQLTLYAFSSDNWNRPAAEVHALLALCAERLTGEAQALADAGIRTQAIGRRDRLPAPLVAALTRVEALTQHGRRMTLRIAMDYSSRAAIADSLVSGARWDAATRTGAPPRAAGTILPPVDLLIRTGGEHRLSDFLLWECAYAEFAFLDVLFPDFRDSHLDGVLADYAQRDRRFGGLPVPQRA